MDAIEAYKRLEELRGVSRAIKGLADNEEYIDGEDMEWGVVLELKRVYEKIDEKIDKYVKVLSEINVNIEED